MIKKEMIDKILEVITWLMAIVILIIYVKLHVENFKKKRQKK
jgi:preprotein translocase subunit SecG